MFLFTLEKLKTAQFGEKIKKNLRKISIHFLEM